MKTCLGGIVSHLGQTDPAFAVENDQRQHSVQAKAIVDSSAGALILFFAAIWLSRRKEAC